MFGNLREEIKQEIWGIVLISVTVLTYLGLLSERTGGFGDILKRLLHATFGQAASFIPALLGLAGLLFILQKGHYLTGSRAVGWGLGLLVGLGWLHRFGAGIPDGHEFNWGIVIGLGGGYVGAAVTWGLREVFGPVGRDVVLGSLTLIAFLLATDLSLVGFALAVKDTTVGGARWTFKAGARFIGLFEDRERPARKGPAARYGVRGTEREPRAVEATLPGRSLPGTLADRAAGPSGRTFTRPLDTARTWGSAGVSLLPGAGPAGRPGSTEPSAPGAAVGAAGPGGAAGSAGAPGVVARGGPAGQVRMGAGPAALRPQAGPAGAGARSGYQQISLTEDVLYQLPPLSLLDQSAPGKARRARQDVEEKARVLEETLASFGVKGKVIDARRGPVVTRFEFQPAPGMKVARIVSLADDIALAMASQDVRIEAPIPGKRAVGIEVPNLEVSTVPLREVLEDPEVRALTSKLTVVLGKDIAGRPITGDLDRLLHVLIAGATGSGKSVCINAIIASLLFRAKPSEVKLLLIDPKVVELSVYEGIPHLVAPVVTDPKKAAGCLRWAVKQMEERYELFAAAGVRDIGRYNALVAHHRSSGADVAVTGGLAAAAPWGATPSRSVPPAPEPSPAGPYPLPYIVIVIDELADLMMVAPVDVEDAIWRLAQMARAAGIHLVVATQRPSVDVITGTIKANIPTRVAFAVSSQVDSRTIIDVHGAEKLLGHGDMLYSPVGVTKPIRVQGAYVSDREIEALVDFVKGQGRPRFAPDVLTAEEASEEEPEPADDDLFEDAVRVVMETGQASISMLQRKLRVGYTRAGRLIDMMEEKGLVGPFEGSKARDILMTWDQYRRSKEAARRAGAEREGADRRPDRPGAPGLRAAEGRPDGSATPRVTLGPRGRRPIPADDDAADDEDR